MRLLKRSLNIREIGGVTAIVMILTVIMARWISEHLIRTQDMNDKGFCTLLILTGLTGAGVIMINNKSLQTVLFEFLKDFIFLTVFLGLVKTNLVLAMVIAILFTSLLLTLLSLILSIETKDSREQVRKQIFPYLIITVIFVLTMAVF
jgi:hypothetical protein